MRILHIVTGMQKASGVTVFVAELTAELRTFGHEVTVVTRNEGLDVSKLSYDVVHIHGLWDPWLHQWSCVAHKAGIPVVWSPHGMLQKWALKNKWWKKFAALALYQWRDLHSAALLHATAQSEVDDIRRLGLKNRVVVAPLGVRLSDKDVGLGRRTRSTADARTLLFVSRVQRKKGLPNLVEAWSRLKKVEVKVEGEGGQWKQKFLTDGWTVRVVGPDQDNHTAELKAQCDRHGLTYNDETIHCTTTTSNYDITFTGPKYDAELDSEYSNADLFVLPTHSENFGSVVIESLAHSVPVITTKQAPWSDLEEFKCGWWIDDNVNALVRALKEALSLRCATTSSGFDSLAKMGERGRALVEAHYTWSSVCDKISSTYMSILRKP